MKFQESYRLLCDDTPIGNDEIGHYDGQTTYDSYFYSHFQMNLNSNDRSGESNLLHCIVQTHSVQASNTATKLSEVSS